VSKLEFLFMFFFVLVRVISWIVRYAAKTTIHEITRNITKRGNMQNPTQMTFESGTGVLFVVFTLGICGAGRANAQPLRNLEGRFFVMPSGYQGGLRVLSSMCI
jgi:hypothetical protein